MYKKKLGGGIDNMETKVNMSESLLRLEEMCC